MGDVKYKPLSRNSIKIIAMITMIIDHSALILMDSSTELYSVMRLCIGRIAFPLFCMLFIEGMMRTQRPLVHVRDLALFAVLTEPIYDYALRGVFFTTEVQSVMWSWLLGAVLIITFDVLYGCFKKGMLDRFSYPFCLIIVVISACFIASLGNFDYSCACVLCIAAGYFLNLLSIDKATSVSLFALFEVVFSSESPGTFLAVPFALLYDPEKKCLRNKIFKYFFYWFYPVHLLVLCIIRNMI